jgi:hypothetical protein
MAKLHRPPAPDLARQRSLRQRSFKCFRTRFTRDLRQSSSISVYAIAEEASGDAPDFVEVGEAGIAVDDAMRHQRRVQLVG